MSTWRNCRSTGRDSTLIVLCTLLITFPIAIRTQDGFCHSTVCDEVAEVIDQMMNETASAPCDDYFTYVCSGRMENVKKVLEPKNIKRLVGPLDSIQYEVDPEIMLKELKRLRSLTIENLRESEIQPVMFFKTCLRSIRNSNSDLNTMTLRKFSHQVDLPFFDETPDSKDNCAGKSPLATLMKLAMQFGIYPLFKISLGDRKRPRLDAYSSH